mmetsp:Transcript_25841/g.53431  ORF Transcript_25841/g.53431 Transcript_25841/m.53431 type:complete len:181 (+) Transcript_25841:441-983(+)
MIMIVVAHKKGLSDLLTSIRIILVRIPIHHGTRTNEVRTGHAILIATETKLPAGEIKRKHRNRIRILIGHDQKLSAVIELKMTWSFSSGVEESDLREGSSHALAGVLTIALFDTEDGDGFVSAVGDDYESTGLMDADAAAGIHLCGKGRWDGFDGLNQFECGAAFEFFHGFVVLGGVCNI